jgi:hypothetical protein
MRGRTICLGTISLGTMCLETVCLDFTMNGWELTTSIPPMAQTLPEPARKNAGFCYQPQK